MENENEDDLDVKNEDGTSSEESTEEKASEGSEAVKTPEEEAQELLSKKNEKTEKILVV